jgi:hypothetical protein
MTLNVDHFTPLSRAVASIDRDAYAARFAIYDREHKALLRRLATAASPVSAADVAREEQAFRDAIRRIEFADEEHEPTLVPRDEPLAEAAPEPPHDPIWPRPRTARPETLDAVVPDRERFEPERSEPERFEPEPFEPDAAPAPVIALTRTRSVMRRVGERLALAVVVLALVGVGLWLHPASPDKATVPAALRGAADAARPAAPIPPADARPATPNWLSPEMFYSPVRPSPPPSQPPSQLLRPRRRHAPTRRRRHFS